MALSTAGESAVGHRGRRRALGKENTMALFDVPEVPTLEALSFNVAQGRLGYLRMTVYSHHLFAGERQCGSELYEQLTVDEIADVIFAELQRLVEQLQRDYFIRRD